MRLALAAVAALALAATACGGTGPGAVESEPTLAQAAERTRGEASYAFEAWDRGTREGQPSELTCSGAVDNAGKRSRLTCGAKQAGEEMIVIGGSRYSREIPGDTWTKFDTRGSYDQGLSPAGTLQMLRAASQEIIRVGEDEVRGDRAVRYTLTVNCEPAGLRCVGRAEVGVWIDDDALIRRIELDGGGNAWTREYFDFGRPVEIEPPPAGQVEEPPPPLKPIPTPCEDGYATPIGVDEAVDALRRNGFPVKVPDAGCSSPIAMLLTAHGEKDVFLACHLYTVVRHAGMIVTPAGGGNGPKVGERIVANLQCTLFGPAPQTDEALGRLDRAFAELRRDVQP